MIYDFLNWSPLVNNVIQLSNAARKLFCAQEIQFNPFFDAGKQWNALAKYYRIYK